MSALSTTFHSAVQSAAQINNDKLHLARFFIKIVTNVFSVEMIFIVKSVKEFIGVYPIESVICFNYFLKFWKFFFSRIRKCIQMLKPII